MCVFLTPFRSARPLCVYKGDKSEKQHGCQSDSPRGEGQIITILLLIFLIPPHQHLHQHHHHRHHCPACACAGIHAAKLPSHPKSHYVILCSCVNPDFLLKELWRIMCFFFSYHFFIAKNVSVGDQLGGCSWYTVTEVFCFFFHFYFGLSLKQYERSLCSGERSHLLNMGRSRHLELRAWVRVCACECVSACVCECCIIFSVIGWMSSVWCYHTKTLVWWPHPLSLLGCHDVNDGNAGRILRLCCFVFVFENGQGVVYPLFMSTLVIQRKAI